MVEDSLSWRALFDNPDSWLPNYGHLVAAICFCQTPLRLADPTQLQSVGVGVDFVFPRREGSRKEEEQPTPSF